MSHIRTSHVRKNYARHIVVIAILVVALICGIAFSTISKPIAQAKDSNKTESVIDKESADKETPKKEDPQKKDTPEKDAEKTENPSTDTATQQINDSNQTNADLWFSTDTFPTTAISGVEADNPTITVKVHYNTAKSDSINIYCMNTEYFDPSGGVTKDAAAGIASRTFKLRNWSCQYPTGIKFKATFGDNEAISNGYPAPRKLSLSDTSNNTITSVGFTCNLREDGTEGQYSDLSTKSVTVKSDVNITSFSAVSDNTNIAEVSVAEVDAKTRTLTIKPKGSGTTNITVTDASSSKVVFPVSCRKEIQTSDSNQLTLQLFDYTDIANKWSDAATRKKLQNWGCTVYTGSVNNNGLAWRYGTGDDASKYTLFPHAKDATGTTIDGPLTFLGGSPYGANSTVFNKDNYLYAKSNGDLDGGTYIPEMNSSTDPATLQDLKSTKVWKVLDDEGYPQVATGRNSGDVQHGYQKLINPLSMGFLFGSPNNVMKNEDGSYKTTEGVVVYPEVTNNFFQYDDAYDSYTFSTCGNYEGPDGNIVPAWSAFYDKANQKWHTYDQPVRTRETADREAQNEKASGDDYYVDESGGKHYEQYGDFLPLSASTTNNWDLENGTGESGCSANGEQQGGYYCQEGEKKNFEMNNSVNRPYNYATEDTNYWYGFKMHHTFMIDENSKHGPAGQEREQDFMFSGDDDVYMFVDGVKLLDLGGVHGRVVGDVNFYTGDIYEYYDFINYYGPRPASANATNYFKTTIYDRYKQSGKFTDEQLNNMFEDYEIKDEQGTVLRTVKHLKNYTVHDLDFFYMERGGSVSTCNFHFNLPNVKGAINLDKVWNDNSNKDSSRPDSVTYKLKRCIGTPDPEHEDPGYEEDIIIDSSNAVKGEPNHWRKIINVESENVITGESYYYKVKEITNKDTGECGTHLPGKNNMIYGVSDAVYSRTPGYLTPSDKIDQIESATITNTFSPVNAEANANKYVISQAGDKALIPADQNFNFYAKAEKKVSEGQYETYNESAGSVTTEKSEGPKTYSVDWDTNNPFHFKHTGEYRVTITESELKDIHWKQEDQGTSYVFEINVTEKENMPGVLQAEITTQPSDPTFHNTFIPNPPTVKGNIKGTKEYKEETIAENEFQAKIYDKDKKEIGSFDIGTDGKWTVNEQFIKDHLTFGLIGDYVFYVKEYEGYEWGVRYDPTEHTVKFTVTTAESGELELTTYVDGTQLPKIDDMDIHFENSKDYPQKSYGADTIQDGDKVHVDDTIPYKLDVSNFTPNTATLTIVDTLSKGLDLQSTTVLFDNAQLSASELNIVVNEDRTTTMTINKEVPKFSDHTVTYSAKVNAEAYDNGHKVNNDATLAVGKFSAHNIGSKPNEVPEKKFADSNIKDGCSILDKEILKYEIWGTNLTGDTAKVSFKDIPSLGLNICTEEAFTLSVNGETKEYTEADFQIIDTRQFITKQDSSLEIPANAEFSFSYSCIVDAASAQRRMINNSAYCGFDNDPKWDLNPLHNDIVDKVYENPTDMYEGKNVKVGDKIDYLIEGANNTGHDATVSFKDNPSVGLDINYLTPTGDFDTNAFILSYTYFQDGETITQTYNYAQSDLDVSKGAFETTKLVTIPNNATFDLHYSCTVNEKALTEGQHLVENDAWVKVADEGYKQLLPLKNVTPEKNYADSHYYDQAVNVGDVISYVIYAGNFTGSEAYITFSDTTTGGLSFNKDSFKLKLIDPDGKITEDSIEPTIANNTFYYKLENVPDQYKVELQYSATVTEEAYKTLEVYNAAKIGLNHEPDTEVNSLRNSVSPEPVDTATATFDYTYILLAVLLLLSLTSLVVLLEFSKGRNKQHN